MIYPVLTYFADPDPMSLGTFSPPPGMGLATGAGATVEATAPTLIFPPEMKKIYLGILKILLRLQVTLCLFVQMFLHLYIFMRSFPQLHENI